MKIDFNPVSAWKAAPVTVRVTAAVLYFTALVLVVLAAAGSMGDHSLAVWERVAFVVLAYIAVDTALMTLRGRVSGFVLSIGLFTGLLIAAVATSTAVLSGGGFTASSLILLATPVWILGDITLFLPAASAWRKENKTSLLAEVQKGKSSRPRTANGARSDK